MGRRKNKSENLWVDLNKCSFYERAITKICFEGTALVEKLKIVSHRNI